MTDEMRVMLTMLLCYANARRLGRAQILSSLLPRLRRKADTSVGIPLLLLVSRDREALAQLRRPILIAPHSPFQPRSWIGIRFVVNGECVRATIGIQEGKVELGPRHFFALGA